MTPKSAIAEAPEIPGWDLRDVAGLGSFRVRPATDCDYSQQVLRTDVAGMPLEWIDFREAVRLYYMAQVAYTCGSLLYKVYGGHSARTGARSIVEVNSIVATVGRTPGMAELRDGYVPPLNNKTLFRRDANLCLYCGERYMSRDLTRDHVTPLSRGGTDSWTNVVTACRRCNNHKGGRTPEGSGMQLIAVPFTPTYAEYIYLKGRRVLADQMEFLLAHIPRTSPLHARLSTTLKSGEHHIRTFHEGADCFFPNGKSSLPPIISRIIRAWCI